MLSVCRDLWNPAYRIGDVSSVVKIAEVTAEDIDDRVADSAHLFQQRIPKTMNITDITNSQKAGR